MTIASNPNSSPIDNTWLNQDSAQRLITLEKLSLEEPSAAKFLLKVAQEDEHEIVRCSAISRILDLGVLEDLQDKHGKVGDTARQQIYRIIAGTLESQHSENERISTLKKLPSKGVKQVALITKLKTIGSLAVDALVHNEDLADLCLFASSVHVRKSAALKITDTQLLEEIFAKVIGKDKTVSKTITGRLEPLGKNSGDDSSQTESQAADKESLKAKNPKESEESKEVDAPALEPSVEFDAAEKEAIKLSFKESNRLFELRSRLRKLQARLGDADIELREKINKLQTVIAEKIDKNNEYQETLKTKTEELLSSLSEALEEGNSENAMQCWDKIQGNISNTTNNIRAELSKQSNVHKKKIIELRDWKIFAATEKKKEVIVRMQQLIDSKMHASDLSKNISKMHKEWKSLGRSSQNEQLWKEFKKLSDQAYEPCKEYFKERKKLMGENLIKRREICENLEKEYALLTETEEEPDTSKINNLLKESEKNWKLYAPIEQSKIKNLQKRFYSTINQLRKLRKKNVSINAKQKKELISQAQKLATLEDNKQAMNEAKRLQQDWKKLGPTTYKEDQKYWQDFRAACDTIFNKRRQDSNNLREDLKKIEIRLNEILSSLDALEKQEEAAFRGSRGSYKDLVQEFSNSLDPRIKSQRKHLLERFNAAKRKIDSRFRALPDKRQQQLKQSILDKTALLEGIEKALLSEKDAEKFHALQETFDHNAWNVADNIGDKEIDELLNARQNAVISSKSNAAFTKSYEQCREEFRVLCTQAEIQADIDSPVEDKALRMKFQLEQLQSGFGQAKPDSKQNLKYAMDTEMRSIALGPLDESTREAFTTRLNKVLQKLR